MSKLSEDEKVFDYDGYKCLIMKTKDLGIFCGYVGVDKSNSLYSKDYSYEEYYEIEVHGGVTYSSFSDFRDKKTQSKKLWWIGFDCGHAGDLLPGIDNIRLFQGGTFRDMDYVKTEIENLARQLKRYENV